MSLLLNGNRSLLIRDFCLLPQSNQPDHCRSAQGKVGEVAAESRTEAANGDVITSVRTLWQYRTVIAHRPTSPVHTRRV